MTYVMSDIHGCYDKYTAMLEKIKFNDSDVLYILGDIVDRGKEPVKVLKDMMARQNIFPIMGNHDYFALILLDELSADNYTHISENLAERLIFWFDDGGETTFDCFMSLSVKERGYIIEYLKKFAKCYKLTANNNNFILTHAGLPESATRDNLDKYNTASFITAITDYGKKYFDDVFLVTGHMPTGLINPEYKRKIYRKNNHIAIDTGAVFGGVLSCVCLETDAEFYV